MRKLWRGDLINIIHQQARPHTQTGMAELPTVNAPPLNSPLQNSSSPRDLEPSEGDWEKIRKWQEERIQRKLQGQYESAVLHLSEVLQNNLTTPSQISSVRVEGAKNTRPSFLKFLIDPLVPPPSHANDLQQALQSAQKIGSVLRRTDIFESVEARLERAESPFASKYDVDLVFAAKERSRSYFKASTEVGVGNSNEGSASVVASLRNVFGGAETFEANLSLGTTTKRAFNATLTAPVTADLNTYAQLQCFSTDRDQTAHASCFEGLRGAKAILRSGFLAGGMHEFAYEGVVRNIGNLKSSASLSMREAAGQTIKSSVSHTFTLDSRNDRIMPTDGMYLKTLHEFAGLGGDASFAKSETHAQISRPVLPGVSVSFAARSGILWGLGKPTYFSDRFELGGPTSIRSFKPNAMGPRDAGDWLGGDTYWSTGISLISHIPTKAHWPLKSHLWVNAGRLDNYDKNRSAVENVKDLVTRPAVSVGLGLVYDYNPIRLELNFGLPVAASQSDGTRRGLQVGMGLEFL
ncbi:unnamed protein product [Mycena citricolor]|uniref:Bacterial surface antigen (D15) domain-containing protein n=1 Tax=Mycena citricolor TaxID=2018698 RepID=A0AAD2K1Y8_9AGAR|nr:unnamed protein product [Mycena citricolor]